MFACPRWLLVALLSLASIGAAACGTGSKPSPVAAPPAQPAALQPASPTPAPPIPAWSGGANAPPRHADAASSASPALNAARQHGWELAGMVIEAVFRGDQAEYPGIKSWLDDYRAVAKEVADAKGGSLPSFDVDKLVTNNPNFWRAHYDVAPGDIGLNALHASLLLAAGDARRAETLLSIAQQRPGIPAGFKPTLQVLTAQCANAGKESNDLVEAGVKLHDAGDYPAAIAKLQEAIALWPQNGWAHYELGLTLYQQQRKAEGAPELPATPMSIQINGGPTPLPQVATEYALSRRHDPLHFRAWQGTDQKVIAGFMAHLKKGMPAWEKLVKARPEPVDDETLLQLAEAFQECGTHDLALVARQVLIARRGNYNRTDHPFMATSLKALAPGESTDAVLQRLWSGPLHVRQLVPAEAVWDIAKPSADSPEPPVKLAVVQVNLLRFYVPDPQLEERLGDDPQKLANYTWALEERLDQIMSEHRDVSAKGLLVAVGFRSKSKTRIWCQPVEGTLPDGLKEKLEQELAKVEAYDLPQPPFAFSLELKLFGRAPEKFPVFPDIWFETAKAKRVPLSPPDDLFKTIWPEQP